MGNLQKFSRPTDQNFWTAWNWNPKIIFVQPRPFTHKEFISHGLVQWTLSYEIVLSSVTDWTEGVQISNWVAQHVNLFGKHTEDLCGKSVNLCTRLASCKWTLPISKKLLLTKLGEGGRRTPPQTRFICVPSCDSIEARKFARIYKKVWLKRRRTCRNTLWNHPGGATHI